MIYFTRDQAKQLVDMFGGDDEAIAVVSNGEGHSGKGIYVGWKDLPEEGAGFLGAEPA